MNAVDTNVLVYLHDTRDKVKQTQAAALVSSLADGVLFWQVACEYVAAGRKLKHIGIPEQEIWINLRLLQNTWQTVLPDWSHLDRAQQLIRSHALSFWDALILAAALETGVATIYSEDLVGVGAIPGIRLVDPFAP